MAYSSYDKGDFWGTINSLVYKDGSYFRVTKMDTHKQITGSPYTDPTLAIEAAWLRGDFAMIAKSLAPEVWTCETILNSQLARVNGYSTKLVTLKAKDAMDADFIRPAHDHCKLFDWKVDANFAGQTIAGGIGAVMDGFQVGGDFVELIRPEVTNAAKFGIMANNCKRLQVIRPWLSDNQWNNLEFGSGTEFCQVIEGYGRKCSDVSWANYGDRNEFIDTVAEDIDLDNGSATGEDLANWGFGLEGGSESGVIRGRTNNVGAGIGVGLGYHPDNCYVIGGHYKTGRADATYRSAITIAYPVYVEGAIFEVGEAYARCVALEGSSSGSIFKNVRTRGPNNYRGYDLGVSADNITDVTLDGCIGEGAPAEFVYIKTAGSSDLKIKNSECHAGTYFLDAESLAVDQIRMMNNDWKGMTGLRWASCTNRRMRDCIGTGGAWETDI